MRVLRPLLRSLQADPITAGLVAALACLLLAWVNPSWPSQAQRPHLLLVVDVTQSMDVADMPPAAAPGDGTASEPISRLAAVRLALQGALAELPCNSRVGLAIFTEYRPLLLTTPMEVCAHFSELSAVIASLSSQMAWSGNSEVAKGLYRSIRTAEALAEPPSVVLLTDGHEAPPINARLRPTLDSTPGDGARANERAPRDAQAGASAASQAQRNAKARMPGLIVGVGGLTPQPIPRHDPSGHPIGTWGADEVMQTDPYTAGRSGNAAPASGDAATSAAPMLGATPGKEHLSALREPYLQRLASEEGMAYLRLSSGAALAQALRQPAFEQAVPAQGSARVPLLLLAAAFVLGAAAPAFKRLFAGRAGRRDTSTPHARPPGW